MKAEIVNADSIEHLKTLDDNCVDSVVTDPPYGLGDCSPRVVNEALTSWISGQEYQPNGERWLGKSWDKFVPSPKLWGEVHRVLKPGGYAVIFAGSRTVDLMGIAVRLSGFEVRDMLHWIYGSGFPWSVDVSKAIHKRAGDFDDTTLSTDLSKKWEGWGTALKPAHEPILLCRKPLQGTVVDNIKKWAVGGLNIKGCKINNLSVKNDVDRWPTNILLDEHAGSLVDIQAGLEASRFFYCSKTNPKEREAGLEAFEQISGGTYQGRVDGTLGGPIPKRANMHPTVKPLAVMRWLCKLITPPGGLILDPFNGSGTTGCAAVQLGFSYLGIEREPEYAEIARARIEHWGCIKLPEEQKTPKKKQPSLF